MTSLLVALLVDRQCADPSAALRAVHGFSDPKVAITRVTLTDGTPFEDPAAWHAPHPCGRALLRATALELARDLRVEHLLLLRADGSYPENTVRALVAAASADPAIAVASPWRTDLGPFGLDRASNRTRHSEDEVSRWLHVGFGPAALDVPFAADGSALIRMRHLTELGTMDLALDDTGCWELALRARRRGLRAVLAPGCLVQRSAAPSAGPVPEAAEVRVVRGRYPLLPVQIDAVTSSGAIHRLRQHAIVTLAREAARTAGWWLDAQLDAASPTPTPQPDDPDVVVHVGGDSATIEVDGFRAAVPIDQAAAEEQLADLLGRPAAGRTPGSQVPA